jgi:hypothetical protein
MVFKRMNTKQIVFHGLFNALAAAAYIGLIALLLSNAGSTLGPINGPLAAAAFLLVFVISAAVMGIIIFGRPVLWYFNGRKEEAVHLLAATIVFLVAIAAIVFAILVYSG